MTGSATLKGTLNISLAKGFHPVGGDTFEIPKYGDFKFHGDGRGNAFGFTCAVECGDEIVEGIESHVQEIAQKIPSVARCVINCV
jgi:hypothetical protein